MSNNKLSYLNRNFEDFKDSLLKYVKQNYPQLATEFNDASIGSWLIDLMASIGDNLSFYIDKTYSETNVETAQRTSSLYNLARNNGFKVPGPKGSIAEVVFSCVVPIYTGTNNSQSTLGMPSQGYLPIIRKGTKVSSRNQVFEVMEDIDFAEQFDSNGVSDREEEGIYGAGNAPTMYRIKKRGVVVAGESKIYRQTIEPQDIVPFMEIVIPDTDVMNIESILVKDGGDFESDPTMNEFMQPSEYSEKDGVKSYRFFEVDSLVDQYRWGDDNSGEPQGESYGWINTISNASGTPVDVTVMSVKKGKWHGVTQKFITEFTDNGYLKVIFGSGEKIGEAPRENTDISEYQMTKMIRNNFLGKLPKDGCTLYILYRKGGGASSNVAAGAINNISYFNVDIGRDSTSCDPRIIAEVKNSIRVTNPQPSISGKDAPTADELKAMIKYNSGAQNRCVTLKDYENRVCLMPPRYGCPFRVSVTEENNKVMLYILGLTHDGKLSNAFPQQMIYNIMNYLSLYRSLNDYVEIKPAKIINVGFNIKIFVDKNYVTADVERNVINAVKDYMDINKHRIGEDIFVGDLEKTISNIDGVINLIDMQVFNINNKSGYSTSKIGQPVYKTEDIDGDVVDLDASDYILNSSADSMFEIRMPEDDITVVSKRR